jgi:hypothetical protein
MEVIILRYSFQCQIAVTKILVEQSFLSGRESDFPQMSLIEWPPQINLKEGSVFSFCSLSNGSMLSPIENAIQKLPSSSDEISGETGHDGPPLLHGGLGLFTSAANLSVIMVPSQT